MASAADPFARSLAYLEAHCHQGQSTPYHRIDFRYALLLWTFAECADAHTILEIGIGPESVSGCTFIHFLDQQPGKGHLVSVDIDPDLPQASYHQLAVDCGVGWSRVYGDSLSEAVQVPLRLGSVDLLYIDGDHDAAHAAGDLRKFLPYLRPGGYLLIDDFPPEAHVGEGRLGIETQVPWFLHAAHNAPAGNGRLIWQRPLQ